MLRRFIGLRLLSEEGAGTGGTAPVTETTTTATEHGGGASDRTYTQAEIETIVKDRLERQRRQFEAAQQRAADEAKAAALKEQGDFKALYEQEQARVAQEAQRVAALEVALATRDHAALIRKAARAAGLDPDDDDLVSRLRGETEEELVADAKKLAARLAPPPPRPGTRQPLPARATATGTAEPSPPHRPLVKF